MAGLISIKRLTKYFRHQWTFRPFRALADVSLEVREGEIFGLIGHNGAGKTTTFKLILGLLRPTSGEISFDGIPSRSVRARRHIGFLPEQPYFHDYLSVRETLDFYGTLYGLGAGDRRRRIGELAERLRLAGRLGHPIRSLSKGTLQRVGIAQAIIHLPRLAILDEPMSGLDPAGRKDMRDLIHGLKHEGTTVVFSSHILPDAEALCDRVGVLVDGELRDIVDLSAHGDPTATAYLLTVSGLGPGTIETLARLGGESAVESASGWTLRLGGRARVQEALRLVQVEGGVVEALVPIHRSLEERFLSYVQGTDAAD